MFKKEDILGNPNLEKINKTPVITNLGARAYIDTFFNKKYHQVSATHPLLDKEKDYFIRLDAAINRQDSLQAMVLSLRDTIAKLAVFEEKTKNSQYQKTRYQSALDFGGNAYKPLIDLCRKLLSIFAINHFRDKILSEKIENIAKGEKNDEETWCGLQILF